MQLCSDVKRICTSLQDLVTFRCKKGSRRQIQISEPFNFQQEKVSFPGLSEEKIQVLRDQAAATRVGIADNRPPRSYTPDHRPATSHSTSSLLDYTTSRYPVSTTGGSGTPSSMSMSTRSLNRIPLPQMGGTFHMSMPISPVSTIGSSDLDDFQLGSPVSPLSPRGSPKSAKSRLL